MTRHWTANEIQEAIDRIANGGTTLQVARALGRSSANAVELALQRRGYSIPEIRTSTIAQVRSPAQVAMLLGVDDNTVYLWLRRGWLKANSTRMHRAPHKRFPNGNYLITDDQLQVFLSDPIYSVLVDPAHIANLDWRTMVEEARAIYRLLTVTQAAERLYVSRYTIVRWLGQGYLHHIRLSHCDYIPTEALDTFDPAAHDRRGRPVGERRKAA
jgi:excisionase family DNA binding protein